MVSNVSFVFKTPVLSMAPNEGLNPYIPQKLAGLKIDPAVCVPNVTGKAPRATATAEPDDEVPVILSLF